MSLKMPAKYGQLILLTLIFVMALTLLNARYLTRLKRPASHDNPIVSISPESNPEDRRVLPSCSQEFEMDKLKVSYYEKINQISLYNGSDGSTSYHRKVLILTPISNSGEKLANYFTLLCSLTYPHELVSVALGEDTSKDRSFEVAQIFANKLAQNFRRMEVFHFNDSMRGRPKVSKHDVEWQLKRRIHLAHARNQLLFHALKDEEWILWIDSDVKYIPPDIVQHLMSANAEVVAASCMFSHQDGSVRAYDLNSWQETADSYDFLSHKKDDYLMLEGYAKSKRRRLPEIKDQGNVVNLDGVGGCTLMVKADCHRKGLVFPAFVYDHHVETEGLGKMAKKMNFTVKGLPFVYVLHS